MHACANAEWTKISYELAKILNLPARSKLTVGFEFYTATVGSGLKRRNLCAHRKFLYSPRVCVHEF